MCACAAAPYPTTHSPWKKGQNGHGYNVPGNGSYEAAGLDQNCDGGGPSPAGSNALGSAADQDRALSHNFAVLMRLGVFDPLNASSVAPFSSLNWKDMGSAAHQQLALEAAQSGHVLLKNAGKTLPLDWSRVRNVSMIGPNWEVRVGGYSGGGSRGPFTLTTAAAIDTYLGLVSPAPPGSQKLPSAKTKIFAGCAKNGSLPASHCARDPELIAAAVGNVALTDVTLVAIGIDSSFEGENYDYRAIHPDIGLPGAQLELVEAVAAASERPVVVLVTGTSVDLSALKSNPKVGAILWRGYAGEAAGQATADLLFGKVSPSGRLPISMLPASFVSAWKPGVDPYTGGVSPPHNASYFDHHMRPNSTSGNPGRTYRFYSGAPAVYDFGVGLGYTSFGYELLSASEVHVEAAAVHAYAAAATARPRFRRDNELAGTAHTIRVRVTNHGEMPAAHSVLSFVSPPEPGVDGAPIRSLAGFEKVQLEAFESTVVELRVSHHDLTLTRPKGGRKVVLGEWTVQMTDSLRATNVRITCA